MSAPSPETVEELPVSRAPVWLRWSDAEFARALTIAFAALLIAGLLHHEMWRDELQGWLMARHARSIPHLIYLAGREGHPALWHLLLYPLARAFPDPAAMQFLQAFFAAGSVYLMARFAPFTRLQKFLLAFGYFPFFEYGMLSRSYPLGVFFVFAFCALYPITRKRWPLAALCLLLLGNTSLLGLMIAMPLAALLLWDLLQPTKEHGGENPRLGKFSIVSLLVVGAGCVLFAVTQLSLRALWKHAAQALVTYAPTAAPVSATSLWCSYLPLPDFTEFHFWGSNFLWHGDAAWAKFDLASAIVSVGSVAMVVGLALIFSRAPRVLFVYLCGTLLLLLGIAASGGALTAPRHLGHLFIVAIACWWLMLATQTEDVPEGRVARFCAMRGPQLLTLWLALHAVAGFFAWGMDLRYPFSGSQQTANWIRQKGLNGTFLAGGKAAAVSSVTAYLDQPIFYLETNRKGTYIFRHRRAAWNKGQRKRALRHLRQLMRRKSGKEAILLILNEPLMSNQSGKNKPVPPLYHSPACIVGDEEYFVYYVPRAAPAAGNTPK